jgi:hypothetical protein
MRRNGTDLSEEFVERAALNHSWRTVLGDLSGTALRVENYADANKKDLRRAVREMAENGMLTAAHAPGAKEGVRLLLTDKGWDLYAALLSRRSVPALR